MQSLCRECEVVLTADNCRPSVFKKVSERNWTGICRACEAQAGRERYAKYRRTIIERLGNECECCGIDSYDLLSIDHIHGGGHQQAKDCRGKALIRKLFHMPIEELLATFRCLCFNCNYAIGFYGSCPHQWK